MTKEIDVYKFQIVINWEGADQIVKVWRNHNQTVKIKNNNLNHLFKFMFHKLKKMKKILNQRKSK